jgi:hypothetical protein
MESIRICATSGRENSAAELAIAQHLAHLGPGERDAFLGVLGLVLAVAIVLVRVHQNEFSNLSGVMPSSFGANRSNSCCASYEP